MCASVTSKLFGSPKNTSVCLTKEHDWRLNPSPPANQEVGGPDREGSSGSGSTRAVSRWMNGSLSAAWERMGRGSCVPTTGIRQRENCRLALQLSTRRQRAYTLWFFFSWAASISVCLQRKTGPCALLDWLAPSDAARLCAPTRKPSRILFVSSHGYSSRQENIGGKKNPQRGKKGGSKDFFHCARRLSAVAEALRGETHGSLCPKGAVALWTALDFFFLGKASSSSSSLRMAVLNLKGVDFVASCVDYIIWEAECETRPYLPERESNILTYLLTLPHQRYARCLWAASNLRFIYRCVREPEKMVWVGSHHSNHCHATSSAVIHSAAFIVYILSVLEQTINTRPINARARVYVFL